MRTVAASLSLVLSACGAPQPSPGSSAPRPSAPRSSPAAAASAETATPPRPPVPRPLFALVAVAGPEPRLTAESFRRATPAVAACLLGGEPEEPLAGWLVATGSATDAGAITELTVQPTEGVARVAPCVDRALRALTLEGLSPGGGAFAAWVSVATPDTTAAPPILAHEKLLRADGGRCAALEVYECPPRKICKASERRPVPCPELHGTPARVGIGEAELRLDLGVSGGKTGQGSEEVILFSGKGTCAALKIARGVGDAGSPGAERREVVDIPCARFRDALGAAKKHLAGRRPRGTEGAHHAVQKSAAIWRPGPSDAPEVEELRWTGADALDEPFGLVVREAGRAIAGRGELRLPRLEP